MSIDTGFNGTTKSRQYLRFPLMKFSPILHNLILQRSTTIPAGVRCIKSYEPGSPARRPHLILTNAPAEACWIVLDNMAISHSLPAPRTASFPDTFDLWQYAQLHRVALYLGINYAKRELTERMYASARKLISPDCAKNVFRDFGRQNLAREIAVISIAEHFMAMALETGKNEDEVWSSDVLTNYGHIEGLPAEVDAYWRRMMPIRIDKRGLFAPQRPPLQIPQVVPQTAARISNVGYRPSPPETVVASVKGKRITSDGKFEGESAAQQKKGNSRGVGGRNVPGADSP